jgi:hypothetical protein
MTGDEILTVVEVALRVLLATTLLITPPLKVAKSFRCHIWPVPIP